MLKQTLLSGVMAIALFGFTGDALAKDKLNEASIKKFYKEAEKVQTASEAKIVNFYRKHTREDFVLTLQTIVNIAGSQPQRSQDVFNKEEMIKTTVEGLNTGEIQSVEYTLVDSDIANNGRAAKTKSTVFSKMVIKVPTAEGDIKFDSEVMMFCNDELALNNAGIIQITKSTCSNETNMKPQ